VTRNIMSQHKLLVSCVGYQRKRVVRGRIQLSLHIIGTFEYKISVGDLI
jgi:hypothetical protein